MGEHVEILLCGVDHTQRIGREQLLERCDVDRERVDQHEFLPVGAAPSDLDERELRKVRALAVELGVEGIAGRGEQCLDEVVEIALSVDPARRRCVRQSPAAPDPAPVTTSKPAPVHAIIPPATFTTSALFTQEVAGTTRARTGATDDVGGLAVERLDVARHRAERHERRMGDVALRPLVGLSHVDDPRRRTERRQVLNRDLRSCHDVKGTDRAPRGVDVAQRIGLDVDLDRPSSRPMATCRARSPSSKQRRSGAAADLVQMAHAGSIAEVRATTTSTRGRPARLDHPGQAPSGQRREVAGHHEQPGHVGLVLLEQLQGTEHAAERSRSGIPIGQYRQAERRQFVGITTVGDDRDAPRRTKRRRRHAPPSARRRSRSAPWCGPCADSLLR
jgi:hypothetical protein